MIHTQGSSTKQICLHQYHCAIFDLKNCSIFLKNVHAFMQNGFFQNVFKLFKNVGFWNIIQFLKIHSEFLKKVQKIEKVHGFYGFVFYLGVTPSIRFIGSESQQNSYYQSTMFIILKKIILPCLLGCCIVSKKRLLNLGTLLYSLDSSVSPWKLAHGALWH